jgi:putative ABC transport system ATP-binding protein
MLQIKHASVTLGKGTKLEHKVLRKLDLTVNTGECVMVIGGNGAGKSTLLRAIAGSLPLSSGKIFVNDRNIAKLPMHARAPMVATVLQDPRVATIDTMTIAENMSFAYMRGKSRGLKLYHNSDRTHYFREKLALLGMGLENRMHELTGTLSGGQRQALSLIMAMVTGSEILLLDEITAALDPKMAETLMRLTARIVADEKRTTLVVTHNMAHALNYGDRTLLMANGHFIKEYAGDKRRKLSPADLAAAFLEI